jgi:hypothetical protein
LLPIEHDMHAVILLYDPDSIPSRDSRFPDPEEDFLYCRCLPVLSQSKGTVEVEYRGQPLSVFEDQVKLIDDPCYRIGQAVQPVPPRPAKAGTVGQIIWHFKDQEPKFFLVIDGRLEHRPYRHSELAPTPQSKS